MQKKVFVFQAVVFNFFFSGKGSYTKKCSETKTDLVIKSRPSINRGGPDCLVLIALHLLVGPLDYIFGTSAVVKIKLATSESPAHDPASSRNPTRASFQILLADIYAKFIVCHLSTLMYPEV